MIFSRMARPDLQCLPLAEGFWAGGQMGGTPLALSGTDHTGTGRLQRPSRCDWLSGYIRTVEKSLGLGLHRRRLSLGNSGRCCTSGKAPSSSSG